MHTMLRALGRLWLGIATPLTLVAVPVSHAAARASPTAAPRSASWPYPNGDLANTRDAVDSTISRHTIDKLHQAWAFRLTGKSATDVEQAGSLAANPIVENHAVYIQDLESNVYALALSTGKLLWEYRVNQRERSGPGPNGVAVVGSRVYGLTPTSAFALNAETGNRIWINRNLLRKGQGTFGIQPQVAGGRVYLASQYGTAPGGGVLMALNASTGAVLWKFNTVRGRDEGVQALGAGAGGAWETPLVGTDGSVTFGTGNPYQSAASAIAHPSRALYTDSDVNLSAATGKLRWYYQGVPDDFKDWDMQASPISASVHGTPVVIGSGKMGYVYVINARTGALVWKKPVGEHNGHDGDSVLALRHRSTLHAPYTMLPGSLGGVLTNLALADGTIYVATLDLAITADTLNSVDGSSVASAPAGEVEALNLATGHVEWDRKVPSLPLGAVTVTNDLVLTTLFTGELIALDRSTGAVVYRHALPTSTNAPIAVAGSYIIIPAGGAKASAHASDGRPQVVAYRVQ